MPAWLTALLGVVTALVGGGIGAFISYWLSSSKPRVTPTSITLSTKVIPYGARVDANSELLAQLRDHPYLNGPSFVGAGKVDEREYVEYLTGTLAKVQTYILVDLPGITERAQQLKAQLAADDLDGVARIWAGDPNLWQWVEQPYVREEFRFDDDGPPSDELSGNDAYEWWKDDFDNTYYVTGRQPPYSKLKFAPTFKSGAEGARSTEIAQRLCQAFAYFIKPDLRKVLNFLARSAERRTPELESLSKKIEAELRRLIRLSATALISNTGGTPVSISTTCTTTLYLAGYEYEADGKRYVRSDPYVLEGMILVDELGQKIPPLAIGAGDVKSVTAVYRQPLSQESLRDEGTLYDLVHAAFSGSERPWQLAIEAALPRKFLPRLGSATPFRQVRSPKIPVRSTGETDSDILFPQGDRRVEEIVALRRNVVSLEKELSVTRTELSLTRQDAQRVREGRDAHGSELDGTKRNSQPRARSKIRN